MARYSYYINNIEVFPLNADNLDYKFKKKSESSVVLEKTLDTELVFSYQSGGFNFKTQEFIGKCDELNIVINRNCNGVHSIFYEGIFSITEGQFDDFKCEFKVKARLKTFLIEDVEFNMLQTPFNVYEGAVYGVIAVDYATRNYTQAKYFKDVVLYIAQKSNPKIKGIISNFFQINPTASFYVPGVTNNYQYMAFVALSDVQEPIPSNLATNCMVSFLDLMGDLNVLFDVHWYVDSGYYLHIEHTFYFIGTTGLNLINNNELKGLNQYTYDLGNQPKEETWTSQGHSQTASLIYSGISSVGKNKNVKSYTTKVINTDYHSRFYGGGSDSGMFLFATDGGAFAGYWQMLNDGYGYQYLAPSNLVKDLKTYNRPNLYSVFKSYQLPNVYTDESGGYILKSEIPIKKQTDINFTLCCDQNFDSGKIVLTDFGNGYLEEATLNTQKDLMKMTLKYKVKNCSGFMPSDLTGLQLWLKANDVVITAGLVSQWNDSSGNANHAIQANATFRPSHTAFNSVKFINDDFLTTPAFQLFPSKRGTIIALFKIVGAVSAIPAFGFSIISTNDGSASVFYDLSANLNYNFISNNEGVIYPQNMTGVSANPFGVSGIFSINRFENTYIKTRNNSLEPIANPAINSNTQPASKPVIIGDNPNNLGGTSVDFELIELIIYDHSLTDVEMEKIEYYFVETGLYNLTKFIPY